MEQITKAQAYTSPDRHAHQLTAKKIFEINPHHPIIKELLERVKDNIDVETQEMADLLFETALLNSGYQLKSPSEYAKKFYRIFNGALGIPRDAPIEEIEVDLDEEEDDEFDEDELDDEEFDGKFLYHSYIRRARSRL